MPATTLNKMGRMIWGLSLHGWEDVMRGSLAVVGVFGLLVGLSTFFVVTLQREEIVESKNEMDSYKLTVESKVADAKKEGLDAGKSAGDALLRAAQANERAAQAELELAKYRSGRSITSEQHRVLVQWLNISPKGRVIVKPNFLNGEATLFANQISSAFNESGFSGVGDAPLEIVSSNRPGLFLAVRDVAIPPPQTEPILKAFFEAGISIESGYGDWVPDNNTVVILVSEKP
jgi:hypothetical protein